MKRNQKETLKKLGVLFLSFVLTYSLLRVIIHLGDTVSPWIYYVGTALYGLTLLGVFVAFFILNGYTLGSTPYEREDLPKRWSEEKKTEFLRKLPENREKAKGLLYILLPIVVSFLLSYVELAFFL